MKSPVIYSGPSMNPTLRQGDIVDIVYPEKREIKPGDIIYFWNQKNTRVIHRVIKTTAQGFQTKGDNNKKPDPEVISRDQVMGKVVRVFRKEASFTVHGGLFGRIYACVLILRKKIIMLLNRLSCDAYYFFLDTGFIQQILPKSLQPKKVMFQSKSATNQLKLIFLRKEIGRYDQRSGTWIIQPPYGLLFSDEEQNMLKI